MQRLVAIRDGRIAVVEEGSGPLVVAVHGTPSFSHEWRHVRMALRDSHRVVTPDHLGFGMSDRPRDADYRPESHAARFRELMTALAPHEPLTLIVHDFGGPIALDWALDHPDMLARLVVVNSWMWPFDDDPVMARRARLVSGAVGRWLYRRWNASLRLLMPAGYGNRARLTPALHQVYLERFPDADSRERVLFTLAQSLLGSSHFYARLWARREALRAVPLELLWGMRDPAFGPPVLARWMTTFPHVRVTRFPDAGHWPHEEVPSDFVSALQRALAPEHPAGTHPRR